MGTNIVTQIGTLTPTQATGNLLDQYAQAIQQDFVPRNSSGVPTDEGGSLGTSTYQWDSLKVKNGIVLDGVTLDLGQLSSKQYSISSGKQKVSGYPQFLESVASSTSVLINTDNGTYPLELIINNNPLNINSNTTYTGLTIAPSANNTCLVNDTTLAGQESSKLLGEWPSQPKTLAIDNIGTQIGSLGGTVQCFKFYNGVSNEYALCHVDIDNSVLYPFLRGIGGTDRIALTNNNTITLLRANYLFLELAGSTKHTTTKFPVYSSSSPSSPASGDWYFNTDTMVWNRYSGSSWDSKNAIYLGAGILDDTQTIAVEPNDFNVGFRSDCVSRLVRIGDDSVLVLLDRVYVANNEIQSEKQRGQVIQLSESNDRESGVSESASTTYYVYVKENGKAVFSSKPPRFKDHRLGFYHPYEYWRCIGRVFNNSSSNIQSFEDQFGDEDNSKIIHYVQINIGDWDLDANATKEVTHNLEFSKVISVSGIIWNDDKTVFVVLGGGADHSDASNDVIIADCSSSSIWLSRANTSPLDSTNYNATSYNRGVLTIGYQL